MRSTDSYSAHSLLFVHHIMRISKFSVNFIKYTEKLVPGSQWFYQRLKKHSNRFELDSIPENAKCCNNNSIFLMPLYSRLKIMKQHRHVRTNYNKIFKEHSSNPAKW